MAKVPSEEQWARRNSRLREAADYYDKMAKRTGAKRYESMATQARMDAAGKPPHARTWPHFATEEEVEKWPKVRRGGRTK